MKLATASALNELVQLIEQLDSLGADSTFIASLLEMTRTVAAGGFRGFMTVEVDEFKALRVKFEQKVSAQLLVDRLEDMDVGSDRR